MPPTIGIFMSRGTRLADWARQGILERETAVYRELASTGTGIFYLFVPDRHIPAEWSQSLLPLRVVGPDLMHRIRAIGDCTVLRGHNGRALAAPMLASVLFGKRLVVRFGYIWSMDMIHRGASGLKLWLVLGLEWLACRFADAVIVASEKQATYLRDVHGLTSGDCDATV